MSRKKTVIAAVMVVIGLPLVLALAAVLSFHLAFYSLDRANGPRYVPAGEQPALRHQLYDRLLRG